MYKGIKKVLIYGINDLKSSEEMTIRVFSEQKRHFEIVKSCKKTVKTH